MGHFSTCTMRKNRVRNCPLSDEKHFKKLSRGSYEYALYNDSGAKINIVRWLDGSVVTISSTA